MRKEKKNKTHSLDLGPAFNRLPPEILLSILSYLECDELTNLLRTNLSFNALSDDKVVIRFFYLSLYNKYKNIIESEDFKIIFIHFFVKVDLKKRMMNMPKNRINKISTYFKKLDHYRNALYDQSHTKTMLTISYGVLFTMLCIIAAQIKCCLGDKAIRIPIAVYSILFTTCQLFQLFNERRSRRASEKYRNLLMEKNVLWRYIREDDLNRTDKQQDNKNTRWLPF